MWQSWVPTSAEENSKKQVRVNLNEGLGSEPTLSTGVTLFLSGGKPSSNILLLHHGLTVMKAPDRGARPKVQSSTIWSPSRPERPDPVSHPCMWIEAEMLKIPHIHCWKTLLPSGERTMFSHVLCESLSEPEALCLACWQAVVFWLPWAQQETAGWWAPPLTIPGLHLEDYMPSPTSFNFWIMRQQKTMALARVLQACAEKSGVPTGVLCDVVWELQWDMAPLLVLNGNKIVEASLLRPIWGECRTPHTPEEEAALLGDIIPDLNHEIKHKIQLPQVPEQLEIYKQVQPVEQTATSTASLPSPPSQPSHLPPQKAKKPWERETGADIISAAQWVWAYIEENYRVPKWWREFWSLLWHPCDSTIQKLACQQATAFWIPAMQLEKDGWWIIPQWKCWGGGNTFPQKISRGAMTTKKWGGKKQLPWPWLFRAAPCDLECPQECYVEWCRSSANVLLPSLRKMVSWTWRCWMLLKRTSWFLLPCLLLPLYPRSWRGRTCHTDT